MDENLKKLSRSELADRLMAAVRERDRAEKQAEDKRAMADKLMQQMRESLAQLREAQARLNDTQDAFVAAKEELSLRREEKEAANREAGSMRTQLEEAMALLTGERDALKAAREQLAQQEADALARTQELEKLREECAALRSERDALAGEVQRKEIAGKEAGSVAEAALKVYGVFEKAQEAADVYLLNIGNMLAEQKKACADMAEKARCEAEEMIARASANCEEMKREAQAYCAEQRRQADEDGRQRRQALSEHLNRIRSEIMDSFGNEEG